ncbi:MAG: hypothetical protein ACI9D1_001950 [Cryomorphaceae bacterium]|jgi:hypothetical protein
MKNLKWVFLEFLLVVKGALMAFALNSWWMDMKDQKKEEAYLTQVLQDVDMSIELVENAIELQTTFTYSASEMLKAT